MLWGENLRECRVIIGATYAITLDKFKVFIKQFFYVVNYWKGQQQK